MKLLNTQEVAQIIEEKTGNKMSRREVQNEIKKGYIKAELVSGVYLVREGALINYERRPRGRPRKPQK